MAEEDRGQELPQRVRGAARPGPPPSAPSSSSASSASSALSEELRQRIRAAVEAERARSSAPKQERTTEPPQTNGHTKRSAKPEPAAKPGRTAKPKRTAQPQHAAKTEAAAKAEPVAQPEPAVKDDELTEWPKPSAGPKSATKQEPPQTNGYSQRSALPGHAAQPEPAVKEDKLTERPKPAAGPQPATRTEPAAGRPGRQAPPRPGTRKKQVRRQVKARLLALAVITLVAVSALAIAAVKHFAHSPSSAKPPSAFVPRQEAADRQQAAVWVAQQVSQDVTVSCDKVMCAALAARGFPSRDLVVLGPAMSDPVPSVVVVDTAAVRDMFGTSLATAWAPAVLASFGTGTAEITVRVVAPHGAGAYQKALDGDLAIRKRFGAALLNDAQITLSTAARNQLAAGQVDSRLPVALASVAAHQPIYILSFGNIGPGASAGIPLRFADLAGNNQAAHMSSSAYARAVRASLSAVNAPLRPVRTVTAQEEGRTVLRVEFTAPTPLSPPASL
jgi:hypothetical protein